MVWFVFGKIVQLFFTKLRLESVGVKWIEVNRTERLKEEFPSSSINARIHYAIRQIGKLFTFYHNWRLCCAKLRLPSWCSVVFFFCFNFSYIVVYLSGCLCVHYFFFLSFCFQVKMVLNVVHCVFKHRFNYYQCHNMKWQWAYVFVSSLIPSGNTINTVW